MSKSTAKAKPKIVPKKVTQVASRPESTSTKQRQLQDAAEEQGLQHTAVKIGRDGKPYRGTSRDTRAKAQKELDELFLNNAKAMSKSAEPTPTPKPKTAKKKSSPI